MLFKLQWEDMGVEAHLMHAGCKVQILSNGPDIVREATHFILAADYVLIVVVLIKLDLNHC